MNTLLRPFQRAATALLMVLAIQAPAHAAHSDSIQSHSANVNGVTLHYLQAGKGSESPVVLLHGYAETSHMWRPLMPRLADRHVVIAPDLRGAGSSVEAGGWLRQEDHGPGYPRAGASRSAIPRSRSSAMTSA